MAEALVVGISDLLPELLTYALIVLCPLQSAGAIAACPLETVPDGLDHFLVVI